MNHRRKLLLSLLASLSVLLHAGAPAQAQQAIHQEPFTPFKIAGNLYYVGTKGHGVFLVATPDGHILINNEYPQNVPMIRDSVEKLGFKFGDIKIMLISHAHIDHDGGSAAIKAQTGASYMVMEPDVAVVESGGKADFHYNFAPHLYPPVKVDRVLHDGDEVQLGGSMLVARLTPGHTKGCTTWTMKVQEAGKTYNVVIVGSTAVGREYKLVDNPAYPGIAADYERSFTIMESLPGDIYVAPHGSQFNLEGKYARLQQGTSNPFVDPAGYARFIVETQQQFRAALAKQQAAQQAVSPAK